MKNREYILELYFSHSTTVKFSSFESWRIQIEPQKNNNRGKEGKNREFDILILKKSNKLKVYAHDVTSCLNRAEITFNCCALENFLCSETTPTN